MMVSYMSVFPTSQPEKKAPEVIDKYSDYLRSPLTQCFLAEVCKNGLLYSRSLFFLREFGKSAVELSEIWLAF